MASRAASYAALIQDRLGVPVRLRGGRLGQFDVLVDGRVVASRKGGLLAKLVRRPWPDDESLVDAVRAALPPRGPDAA